MTLKRSGFDELGAGSGQVAKRAISGSRTSVRAGCHQSEERRVSADGSTMLPESDMTLTERKDRSVFNDW